MLPDYFYFVQCDEGHYLRHKYSVQGYMGTPLPRLVAILFGKELSDPSIGAFRFRFHPAVVPERPCPFCPFGLWLPVHCSFRPSDSLC